MTPDEETRLLAALKEEILYYRRSHTEVDCLKDGWRTILESAIYATFYADAAAAAVLALMRNDIQAILERLEADPDLARYRGN